MNNNELKNIINGFIQSNRLTPDKTDLKNKEKVEKLLKGLDEKQAQSLGELLSDPKKAESVLNSPAARALIKKLSK
ncbi:MAG: hypothetical protein IIU14_08240 [Ruminococcus sp.]|nr:hypothetical protein [Ruminococcus sp.]